MQLLIADLTLPLASLVEERNIITVQIPAKHRDFFKNWVTKTFKLKPWESPSRFSQVERFAYVVPDGEGFSSSKKREFKVCPKFMSGSDVLVLEIRRATRARVA